MEKLKGSELNTERYYQYLNNIINNRGQGNIPKGEYKEGHHIILRCFGGTGNTHSKDPNIIGLYPEEHYTAHKILAEDNNCSGIKSAFSMMAFPKSQNMTRRILSPEEYAEARKLTSGSRGKLSEAQYQDFLNRMEKIKETGAGKGRKKTEEHKQKIKESNLGKKHNISDEGREVLKNNGRIYGNSLTPQEYQEACDGISKQFKNTYWYVDENGRQFRSKDIIDDPKIKRQRIKTGNSNSGGKGANNGISNIQVFQGEDLPAGYVWGQKHNNQPSIRITNGKENRIISDIEQIPEGGYLGLTVSYNYRETKILINNGEKEIYINKTEELPEGYTYGRIPRMYITNGVKNKRIKLTEEIPSGWWKGRISK